jgi:hypothetical protein
MNNLSASNQSIPLNQSTSTSSNWSYSNWNFNAWTIIIVVVVLALLGINVFSYLANGTTMFTNLFKNILEVFYKITGKTITATANTSAAVINAAAEGGKEITHLSADIVDAGLTGVQNTLKPIHADNGLNNALNSSSPQKEQEHGEDYEPNEATSSIQENKTGWCFIGEESNVRTCAKVGQNDKCMSGDIFPSREICVNPSLR